MAKEDYTTYTVVDPNSRFTVSPNDIAIVDLSRSEDAWVVDDKGAAFFDGDYNHTQKVNVATSSNGSTGANWVISNEINDFLALLQSTTTGTHGVRTGYSTPNVFFSLHEGVTGSSSFFQDFWFLGSFDTDYFLTMIRDETVGAFGTLYCYIYSDAGRTVLLDTLSLALHEKIDFRYIYGVDSWRTGGAIETFNATFGDLNLTPATGSSRRRMLLRGN